MPFGLNALRAIELLRILAASRRSRAFLAAFFIPAASNENRYNAQLGLGSVDAAYAVPGGADRSPAQRALHAKVIILLQQ
jgi:hypothetical protein